MRCFFCCAVLFVLFGCAANGHYVKPDGGKAKGVATSRSGEGVAERPTSAVWQQLVGKAGKAGFVIENLNQNAWTLNIRYAGDPKNYIDCGQVTSKVKTSKGERNYDFPAAKAHQQYQLQQGDKVYFVDRRMNLDVNAQVSLESLTSTRTRVKVDSQYTATRDQSVQGSGVKPFGVTDKISFGLSDSATFPNAATKCQATGKFESEVLALGR